MSGESVPLVEVPAAICQRLAEFGASDRANRALLYRALANQPEILTGWIELAWRLRQHCATPRRLRELMIVRGAQVAGCEYELRKHKDLALANGVTAAELKLLPEWRPASTQWCPASYPLFRLPLEKRHRTALVAIPPNARCVIR